eukprot:CAMPEP_0172556486 /NCGR_PEP_ID=MMETSP1067-20121228/66593_1 /TAXON_ID=265564 ORGANISM="Thalassiosira punctigera, Strain Tpunct2005C2" /NCGR_SAMPLE_ID=MMETSP1067 /ASSEMBLY_ACC=CAM_ASM_000444 /LENGTH=58 /DNA_ID=CAMNT_0013345309 /DNA_START=66 /DNA_END=239 /DNA_ORIENTATION=+
MTLVPKINAANRPRDASAVFFGLRSFGWLLEWHRRRWYFSRRSRFRATSAAMGFRRPE